MYRGSEEQFGFPNGPLSPTEAGRPPIVVQRKENCGVIPTPLTYKQDLSGGLSIIQLQSQEIQQHLGKLFWLIEHGKMFGTIHPFHSGAPYSLTNNPRLRWMDDVIFFAINS